MQFMVTFNHVAGVWEGLSAEQQQQHGKDLQQFMADLKQEKDTSLVFLGPDRKTVRLHDGGEMTVTDGAAIPGPEQIGGYFLLEADSVEEAVDWAKRGRWLVGSNEVLPIVSLG